MNKQYRLLEVGETIQEGDEVYYVGEWREAKRIGNPVYTYHEGAYRRPISLSTDTEALASKMAGLTDYPWHICPLGTVGAITDKHGERYWHKDKHARVDSGDWLATGWKFIDNKGNGEDWQNSNMTIPEREKVLNGLAEISEWKNVPAADSYKYDIDFAQWQERRKQRISAGLIDVNDTDVVEMEDNLTWLAKNVSEWPENAKQAQGMLKSKNIYWRGSYFLTPDESTYSKDQWLQRRLELGLESEQSKSTEPDNLNAQLSEFVVNLRNRQQDLDPELKAELQKSLWDLYDSEPQAQEWNGEGLPPVGVECETAFDADKFFEDSPGGLIRVPSGTKIEINGYADFGNGMVAVYSGYVGRLWFSSYGPAHHFRQIQSTAERKRHTVIQSAYEKANCPDDAVSMLEWLYDHDMLKDGE